MSSCPAMAEPPAPLRSGRLAVGEGHEIAWRLFGPEAAQPLLLLHGGPGSGHSARLVGQFDATRFCIVTFDQRGCGGSTPRGETRANDTPRLVADIERLRAALGVRRWLVAGGSWGATLALAYAGQHPDAASGLLLRNLFVPDAASLDWFFRGAAASFPAAWEAFASVLPLPARQDPLHGLACIFGQGSEREQVAAARAWDAWERALSGARAQPLQGEALRAAVDRYRIQSHYLIRQCWLGPQDLAEAARAIAGVPVQFVHGANDLVCRVEAARAVHHLLPRSRFTEVPGAGHDPFAPALAAAMGQALDRLVASREQELA